MISDPEIRWGDCPVCGGDPEWQILTGYDPRTGDPRGWIERCEYCHGTGSAEIDVEPIEEDDLSYLCGER
jgi:hypothetical protein